jgi:hypothetical protein
LAPGGFLSRIGFAWRRDSRPTKLSIPEALVMTILMVMYVGIGLLLSAISVPLILRRIGPNLIYGFRVKQTLEDPEVWYGVNAYAGKGLFLDGLITVIAALVLALVPGISVDRYALSVMTLVFLGLGISLVASCRYLGRVVTAKAAGTKR